MKYSYNSTNHCDVSVPSDSALELRIYRTEGTGKDSSKLLSIRPILQNQRQETIKLGV